MRNFFTRFPTISRLIIAAIVLALLGLLVWGCWSLAYNQGWVTRAPTWDFASLLAPEPPTEVTPATQPPADPTQPPAPPTGEPIVVTPTDPPAPPTEPPAPPTDPPAPPTEPPTAPPTQAPTPDPTPATPVYTDKGSITFTVVPLEGSKYKVSMNTFTYSGGPQVSYSPWYVASLNGLGKEVPEAFGTPISTKDAPAAITTWLKDMVVDPWQLTWFRFQCSIENFDSIDAANARAEQLTSLSPAEYDKLANEALEYFFKNLNKGTAYIEKDWQIELMMQNRDPKIVHPALFARLNGDTNNTPDVLMYFCAKGKKDSFHSNRKAMEVVAKAVGVSTKKVYPRALVNFTEHGTWKWRIKGGGSTPTDPPAPTPTPAPTSTPTPRPTKDPSVRPTPPIGGGETNPENSEDPHTTDHVESTPAPAATDPPTSTPTPTPVPTAVVRPTEECQTEAPTPIREDQNTPPPADPGHNVPTDKPTGEGDDSFDPDSI